MRLQPTVFETFPRSVRSQLSVLSKPNSPSITNTSASTSIAPSTSFQVRSMMATAPVSQSASTTGSNVPPSFAEYKIHSRLPPSPADLSARQSLLTATVLDLFAGYPSKRKLALWTDDASFHDPLTIAQGRKQYEAQWYGLKVTMSEIVQEHAEVVKGGNPIELKLKTMYKVKAVGKEQTIDSSILIHTTGAGTGEDEKITKVEDRWGGDVPPDGIFAKAMRNLNSVTVPAFVSVPKSIEEEEANQAK